MDDNMSLDLFRKIGKITLFNKKSDLTCGIILWIYVNMD